MNGITNLENAQAEGAERIVTRTEKFTGAYRIIEAGSAMTFDMNEGITFRITFNTAEGNDPFTVTMDVSFKTDNTLKERRLSFGNNDVANNTIRMECINFEALGAGTAKPLRIATYHGRGIYMHLWASELGGTAGRKIEYCFYME